MSRLTDSLKKMRQRPPVHTFRLVRRQPDGGPDLTAPKFIATPGLSPVRRQKLEASAQARWEAEQREEKSRATQSSHDAMSRDETGDLTRSDAEAAETVARAGDDGA